MRCDHFGDSFKVRECHIVGAQHARKTVFSHMICKAPLAPSSATLAKTSLRLGISACTSAGREKERPLPVEGVLLISHVARHDMIGQGAGGTSWPTLNPKTH